MKKLLAIDSKRFLFLYFCQPLCLVGDKNKYDGLSCQEETYAK